MQPVIQAIKNLYTKKALVLMYHRIAEVEYDPWNLAVTPQNFEEHLQVLKDEFKVTPLQKIVDNLRSNFVVSRSVGITFDDGYRDNYYHARPLLNQYGIPATFFIPSFYLGQEQRFWWDELTDIVLNRKFLSSEVVLNIAGQHLRYDLGDEAELGADKKQLQRTWRSKESPPTKRCELYLKLWELLRPLKVDQIQETLSQLRIQTDSAVHPADDCDYPMTTQHLIAIAENPLFEVGLHTNTHMALAHHELEIQEAEVLNNRRALEETLRRPVTTISYPYGSYNKATLLIAERQKLHSGFTTKSTNVTKRTSVYEIGRFGVRNYDGELFRRKLRTWLAK